MTSVIGTIVVPLDGSSLAEAALLPGRDLAGRAGATLRLVGVLSEHADAAEERRFAERLRLAARRAGVEAVPDIRRGAPADQILTEAAGLPQPLIVMTTHGRSGPGRWLLGGVASRVVRGGEAPVLLLRSGMTTPASVASIRRIMVPLDGSAYGEAAIPLAAELAELFDAELRLVRVAETGQLATSFGTTLFSTTREVVSLLAQDLEAAADAYLATTSERLSSRGLRVYPVTLRGFPTAELLAQERNALVDLVVMATHARSGLGRIVVGSVAEELLQAGRRPILMVHPPMGWSAPVVFP